MSKEKYTREQIEAFPKATMVYLGMDAGRDGKRRYKWVDFKQGIENDGRRMNPLASVTWFSGKGNICTARPGNVFEIPMHPDGNSVFGGHAKYIEMWANDEDVLEWQALNDVRSAAMQADSERRRDVRKSLPFETLTPFHRAYVQLRPQERPFLLAKILLWIERGGDE